MSLTPEQRQRFESDLAYIGMRSQRDQLLELVREAVSYFDAIAAFRPATTPSQITDLWPHDWLRRARKEVNGGNDLR